MRYFLLIIFLIVPYCSYAGDFIADSPRAVREYENFYIKLYKAKGFSINISNSCLIVSGMEGVAKTGGKYSSEEGGKIYFDNFCFENDKVDITIKKEKISETVEFRILPRELLERDFGC